MFRLSHFLREILAPTPMASTPRSRSGPVVIWNLIRRCNLTCKHCYSISGDVDFPGELSTAEVFAVMDDLKAFHVPALILSGGEPLMRRDIFEISTRAKVMRFYVGLSSNGTLIDPAMADRIRDVGYDYVGVSLDGIGATHDRFRHKEGSYQAALGGLQRLRDRGIKVGVRFTMTQDNASELPVLLDLIERERFPKFYLSHLVYAGRGNKNRGDDATWGTSRAAMDIVIERTWAWTRAGAGIEVVTGNNDADAVHLLHWAERNAPASVSHPRQRASRHHVVALQPGQYQRAPVLGHLERCFRSHYGGAQTQSASHRRALRRMRVLRCLRRKHARARHAACRRSLGRGSGLLSHRCRDRACCPEPSHHGHSVSRSPP